MDAKVFVVIFFSTNFLLLTTLNAQSSEEVWPTVTLPQGVVRGYYGQSYKGRMYSAFEGIPYAKPPVDELRFREPEPADGWDSPLVADKNYQCPFYFDLFNFLQGEEDCLYMYVYVPKETNFTGNENYDVVVHIHGGGFIFGSPSFLAKPKFIMDQDVIYVSFNYRLGILGFLTNLEDQLPANNGLKDQVLALRWIKDNIAHFGGNPDSVTLTGMSAGAACVHFHYFSPLSKGLFHKGLSQSGTALQNWALNRNPRKYAEELGNFFGCVPERLAECLRKVDAADLTKSIMQLSTYTKGSPSTSIGPVIDGNLQNPFLPVHPYETLKTRQVYDVPWITSNVIDEGLFITSIIKLYKSMVPDGDLNFLIGDAVLLKSLHLADVIKPGKEAEVAAKIKDFYFHNESLNENNLDYITKLASNRSFFVDSEYALRLHSKAVKSPTYYYLYSYIMDMPSFLGHHFNGSSHGDDGRFLFEVFGTPQTLTKSDEEMMIAFTSFLAEYAKTGTPVFTGVKWTPVNPESQTIDYLLIESATNVSMQKTERLWGDLDFWKRLPILEYYNDID